MDNNFNMQQNTMQTPVQQPMQQPMYQQGMAPMPVQPKKKTGLIIGIVAAVVALVAVIAIVLVLVLGGDDGIVGTWEYTEDGETASFVFNDDNTGSMGVSGFSFPITWELDGDTLTITVSLFGESDSESYIVDKLTDDTLVLSDGEETIELKRAD